MLKEISNKGPEDAFYVVKVWVCRIDFVLIEIIVF